MAINFSDSIIQEKVVLIAVSTPEIGYEKTQEYLEELDFLVKTAGGISQKTYIQNLPKADSRTFVGTGKLIEIKNFIKENTIDIAVFDDELTPSQIRNIEKILECKIVDRTHLILDIFSKHAQTSYAKTQVELAQYQYLLPRLTKMWTHLEKQRGGIGMRGPGEKEIETDRRIIRDRISLLKEKLKIIDKQKLTQRGNREKFIRIALVGYTNVGKSTIMNLISKSEVYIENKLFATLDTTVRKVVIENLPFLLSDTVGFIRKLPHNLIESFKSTLDEIKEADFILHIVDISHSDFEDQINIVNKTLEEIGANEKLMIIVFNKIDAYKFIKQDKDDLLPPTKENISLAQLKKTWMYKTNNKSVFISAKNKINIDEFRNIIYKEAKKLHKKIYPYDNFLY